MIRNLKIVLVVSLVVGVFTRDEICEHFGFGQSVHLEVPDLSERKNDVVPSDSVYISNFFVNDTIYRWDDESVDWVVAEETQNFQARFVNYSGDDQSLSKPVKVDWKVLMDIQYRLQYFAEIDMEMYAPVFTKAVEALHEKQVIIEGFVIPFDEEGELLALSYNPYASCFFCGKASPASVVSMYLKDKRKRYKVDDFKKFSGILHLNQDNPDEFYYILRDVVEE